MLRAAEANTFRKAEPPFHLPSPPVEISQPRRPDANFSHRICTKEQCQGGPEAWRSGTDPVLLEAEGNPAGAEFVGRLFGACTSIQAPFSRFHKAPTKNKCLSPMGHDSFSHAPSAHTFTPSLSAELYQCHLGLSHVLGQMRKLRCPCPRAGSREWLFLRYSLCHITCANSSSGTGRNYGSGERTEINTS